MVLGRRHLVVDIETEFVEIAASLRDIHSVHMSGVGEDWEQDSQVIDCRQVEKYWRAAVVVGWAGLESAESRTLSLSRWVLQRLDLAYH